MLSSIHLACLTTIYGTMNRRITMRAKPRAYLHRDTNDFGPNGFVREADLGEELTTKELMDLRVILISFMVDKEAHKKIPR
jgi:hypothetical protein